jgi:parallel beta helix pectate lyase-like protein/uncharacterized protein DUF1565
MRRSSLIVAACAVAATVLAAPTVDAATVRATPCFDRGAAAQRRGRRSKCRLLHTAVLAVALVLLTPTAAAATGDQTAGSGAPRAGAARPKPPPPPAPAGSGSLYVSPSGSDSNPGTLERPLRTLQRALDTVPTGQTVFVRAGTYPEWVTATRGGSSSAPVTLQAYADEQPVLSGRLKITASYVHVTGLVFHGGTKDNSKEVLIYVAGGDHVGIVDNELREAAMSAIYLSGSDGSSIVGNWIHDNGTHWNLDHGIYWGSGNGGLIADNVIERSYAYNIQLYPKVDNIVVTRNRISGGGRGGIVIDNDGTDSVDGNQVVANTIFSNAEHGVRTGSYRPPGVGNTVRDNVIYGNPGGNIYDPFNALDKSGNTFNAP